MQWVNPPERYDHILITAAGNYSPHVNPVPGTATSVVLTKIEPANDRLDPESPQPVALVQITAWRGTRYRVPSNAVLIWVKPGFQQEMLDYPFTSGVMQNWVAWSQNRGSGTVELGQGEKQDVAWKPDGLGWLTDRGQKHFFQLIRGTGAGFQGGIWRRFLGLTPGHTYKVSVRLNTLAMGSANGDWWFAAHAAHNGPSGADFTAEQMAGSAALPDGTSGLTAGQFVRFGGSTTTQGKWVECSTGNSSPGKVIGNITLPSDADLITVWVEHGSASGASSGVGIDWVALEDVTGK